MTPVSHWDDREGHSVLCWARSLGWSSRLRHRGFCMRCCGRHPKEEMKPESRQEAGLKCEP